MLLRRRSNMWRLFLFLSAVTPPPCLVSGWCAPIVIPAKSTLLVSKTAARRRFSSWCLHVASTEDVELPSLYKEQEKLLVARGALEGQLMAHSATPLKANVVKGAGSGGGFGSSSSASGGSPQLLKAQAKAHAKVLKQHGVVRIDHILKDETADAMRSYLYQMRHESETLVREQKIPATDRFADVLLKTNRCDMPIPLEGIPPLVATALEEALVKSPVGRIMAALLGENAVLYELSCLMSDPGSQRQVMHPDTPYNDNEEAVLYTCFIALQDITPDMGPTTWLPQTHTKEIHAKFQDETPDSNTGESPKDALLRTRIAVLGTLPKGSCGIFDSRLLHCGGANQSPTTSRGLFYFSFKNPNIGYPGNPGSIRKELVGKVALNDLMEDCKRFAKGKPTKLFVTTTNTP